MQLELKALNREAGATFIYVTHDQEEALTMSDRIAVMSEGRILQLGTPAEIYERPVDRFVADFIGQSNLIPGTLEARDGDRCMVRIRPAAWSRRGCATIRLSVRRSLSRFGPSESYCRVQPAESLDGSIPCHDQRDRLSGRLTTRSCSTPRRTCG